MTEKEITEEKFKGSREEADKLRYDFFKHLTTLSTGSILLTLAMMERLFTKPRARGLVLAALIAFVVCILGSLLSMFMKAYQVHLGTRLDDERRTTAANTSSAAMAGFVLGILLLVLFFGINLTAWDK